MLAVPVEGELISAMIQECSRRESYSHGGRLRYQAATLPENQILATNVRDHRRSCERSSLGASPEERLILFSETHQKILEHKLERREKKKKKGKKRSMQKKKEKKGACGSRRNMEVWELLRIFEI